MSVCPLTDSVPVRGVWPGLASTATIRVPGPLPLDAPPALSQDAPLVIAQGQLVVAATVVLTVRDGRVVVAER